MHQTPFPKPHGPWQILASNVVYHDPWIEVRRDEVVRPDKLPGSHCTVQLKPGVSVLALDEQQRVYLTDEFHYGVGRHSIEVVSGGIEPGEDALESAQRELAEELGIRADDWTPLGVIDPFTTIVVSPTQLFLAQGLHFVPAQAEGTERIRRVETTFDEALRWVLDGTITHAPSCVLLLKTARLLRK